MPTRAILICLLLTCSPYATAQGKGAETPGTLSVTSNPDGAELYVDDSFVGKTPATIDVKPGQHSVRLFMTGYENWVQWVTTQAGAKLNMTATMTRSSLPADTKRAVQENAKTPAQEQKPTPIPQGVTICVAPMAGDFDSFIVGEMEKQQVPVTIIAADPDPAKGCAPAKSLYTMTGVVMAEGKSFSAREVFGLRLHLRDEIQAAVKLTRNRDSVVVWAGDADRGEVKTVAEHIVNQMLKQRPIWVPSPINR